MQRFFTTFRMTYKQKSNLYSLKLIKRCEFKACEAKQNRSLLGVNEDFGGEHNAEIAVFKQLYIIGNQINTATSHNACEMIIAAKYFGNRR